MRLINCSKCNTSLPGKLFNRTDFTNCPVCQSSVMIRAFPALQQKLKSPHAENIVLDEEAGCFFHPQKKAVVACDTCGRFLCSLCDIEFNGGHICASCLDAGKKKKKIKNLETHRVLYDGVALSTAILPLIIFWMTIFTAPISIYIAIRYWNTPGSIIPRTKVRNVLAIVFSSLQLAGWTYFLTRFLK